MNYSIFQDSLSKLALQQFVIAQTLFFNKSMQWLNEALKKEIKRVFEPRYKRQLTDNEVLEIAENLSVVVEEILKFKWRQKYENKKINT